MTQPAISQHLKVLTNAGLLRRDKRGSWFSAPSHCGWGIRQRLDQALDPVADLITYLSYDFDQVRRLGLVGRRCHRRAS